MISCSREVGGGRVELVLVGWDWFGWGWVGVWVSAEVGGMEED